MSSITPFSTASESPKQFFAQDLDKHVWFLADLIGIFSLT